MTFTPAQEWWTTAQIAESGLPDLPATRQGVDLLADRLKWRQTRFARRRAGKGGGWEYSWKLFPNAARRALTKQAVAPKAAAGRARDEVWAWYEALPQTVKAKAEARLLVIQQVEALEPAIGRFLAVDQVATMNGAGARTIWSWFQMIEGIAAHDRLAYLAPRNRAAEKRPRAKECSPEFFEVLKSDFLRLEAPPFTDCYGAPPGSPRTPQATLQEATMMLEMPRSKADVSTADRFGRIMSTMMKAMTGPSSGNVDVDFARNVIPHHAAAISMARLVLESGSDPTIRKTAEAVITAQGQEIEALKAWLEENRAGLTARPQMAPEPDDGR